MWNDLVRVMNTNVKRYSEEKEMAKMLLGQLNTAGGSSIHSLRNEIEIFIKRTKHIK